MCGCKPLLHTFEVPPLIVVYAILAMTNTCEMRRDASNVLLPLPNTSHYHPSPPPPHTHPLWYQTLVLPHPSLLPHLHHLTLPVSLWYNCSCFTAQLYHISLSYPSALLSFACRHCQSSQPPTGCTMAALWYLPACGLPNHEYH